MNSSIYQSHNYNHVFNELQDYMLTNEFIYKFSSNDLKDKIKEKKTENINLKKNDNFIYPSEKDKIFWCFYILHKGIEEYELNKTISFKTEKEFKFKAAENIKKFKDIFKGLKLRVNELQNEFINQDSITIKGLIVLCYMYDMNIMYVKNKTYYEIVTNNEGKTNIIIENKENNINFIYIPFNVTEDMIKSYKDNYWKIENIGNPLKAVSSYTLAELQDICKRLSIQIEVNKKKLTKKELYENIIKLL
jgi:hypothetical protein